MQACVQRTADKTVGCIACVQRTADKTVGFIACPSGDSNSDLFARAAKLHTF